MLSSFKLPVTSLVNFSKLSLFKTNPLDISSVKSDNIFGVTIVSIAPKAAKTKDIITNFLKPDNSFNNLLIAPLKSFALVVSLFGLGII